MKVHEDLMKKVQQERYLGDIIDKSGNMQATIEKRKAKGEGIVAEILSIIEEIPLEKIKQKLHLNLGKQC